MAFPSAFPASVAITRRQALAALQTGKPVYNSQGTAGYVLAVSENGYRWQDINGTTYTFPGNKACVYLSTTNPNK